MRMNFSFCALCPRMRLSATSFAKPPMPSARARNSSAIPPAPSERTSVYRPSLVTGNPTIAHNDATSVTPRPTKMPDLTFQLQIVSLRPDLRYVAVAWKSRAPLGCGSPRPRRHLDLLEPVHVQGRRDDVHPRV